MLLRAAFISIVATAPPVLAGDCGSLKGISRWLACDTVWVKGAGTKAIILRESRRGQIDLAVYAVKSGAVSPKPELHMKGIGQALVPLRAATKGIVHRKQDLLFRDVTGDKSPELIFRVRNGRHADLYVLDLRRTDKYPELQFLEVAQLQNPDGGNARNYLIHDAAQDVVVLEDGSIGAAASDPFLGVDQRFMAFASYKNGRMGVEYIARTAFHDRLKGVKHAARSSKKKSKKTAAHAAKSNKRI
jgi:hypothetical protein